MNPRTILDVAHHGGTFNDFIKLETDHEGDVWLIVRHKHEEIHTWLPDEVVEMLRQALISYRPAANPRGRHLCVVEP